MAEPGQQRAVIESWYEQVWRRRLPMVMTMRSAESLLKEVEFRPSPLAEERLLVAIFDVTDARREEEAMRASEARFRSLFLQAPLGVVVVNAVGNVTDASLQFEQLVGCSRLDMRRLGLEQFFSESDYQLLRKMSFSARAGANVAPLSLTVLPRRGEGVAVDCDLRIVKNAAGASVFTAYYFRPQPITAPPMPAPTAKPTPTPSRLLQAVSDLVLELHADGRIASHLPSRDFAELLPREGSLTGKSFDAAFPAFAEMLPLQDMMQSLEESLDSEVRCEFKYRPSPDEAPRTCEARLVPLTTLPAEPSFGLTLRDLTPSASSQPARESASEEHDPYEFTAIQLLRQAAIITNEKGRICNVNPAAEEMFGYDKEELMGGGLYKLFLPEQPKEFAQKISEHINRHRCWIGKSSFFRKDGSVGRAAVELVPFTEQGTKGFFGLIRDITSEETDPKPSPTPQPASHEPDGSVVKLHRARNDFQVLSSLLSLQANDVSLSDSARLALQESKDRVSAVALVYRLLDGATGEVDFSKFACEMAGQVLRTQQVSDERIRITGPTKSLLLPQKLAISLGLILQELLTSTVHSFGPETHGKIEIKLELTGKDGVLSIQDNGPFHSESELEQRSKGVGWKVVEALTQQIDGEIKILSDLDNEIRLRFHLEPNANSGD